MWNNTNTAFKNSGKIWQAIKEIKAEVLEHNKE